MRESSIRQISSLRERCEQRMRALIAGAARRSISSQDIAHAAGISRATLWRRYGDELRAARDEAASPATRD